ncbi:MAG: aminoacyl-histidine dipeptidase [Firmicutes bacterium]|nr:aminoacyl-histidine dipeptidase [Bacillota bacterium]
MEKVLKNLEPKNVFKHFETLTNIPRESGNEKAVSDYIVKFSKDLGLDVIQEPSLNVIIKKPATPGYEDKKTVIIQGHMDMVCVKDDDLEFDFQKDPIPLVIDGDWIKTKGTTLGGDNGIAVAMAMAILEDKSIKHPEIKVLLTVGEETGMDGVLSLNPDNISGDILINLDSEEEGILLASCAGGCNNIITLDLEKREPKKDTAYKIVLKGLLGGHSGVEINKRRANAITTLARVLNDLKGEVEFELSEIFGGDKFNAIPKRAEATLVLNGKDVNTMNKKINDFQKLLKTEYETSDPNLTIELNEVNCPETVYKEEIKESIIKILCLIPDAVQTMSDSIEGLVESSNNLGVLKEEDEKLIFLNAVRSSVTSLKDNINERIQIICDLVNADMTIESDYPSWPFKPESETRDLMKKVYKRLFNKPLKVDAIHAGLECGFLIEKIGDIDMVSLGPDLFDVHTPNEKLSISSTKRTYDFLIEVLKEI